MARLIKIFLGIGVGILLGGSTTAETLEELYQEALMAEKGHGALNKAIGLYKKVVAKGGDDPQQQALAARAQLRLGLCEEKLGIEKARRVYIEMTQQFSEQPQAIVAAAKQIQSLQRRQQQLEGQGLVHALSAPRIEDIRLGGPGEEMAKAQAEMVEAQLEMVNAQLELQQHNLGLAAFSYGQSKNQSRYESYAYTPTQIPYPHQSVATVPTQWRFMVDLSHDAINAHSDYTETDFDDSSWSKIKIGLAWEDQGYANFDGGGWYRTTIELDADPKAPVYMAFGGVDEHGYVYINGKRIGEHHSWNRPFILDISDAVKHRGKNTIAIYVHDSFGMGGIYGLIDIHQPDDEDQARPFITNRGGSLARQNRFNSSGHSGHLLNVYTVTADNRDTPYPLHIPYPHQSVAEIPDYWKFNLELGTWRYNYRAEAAKVDYDDSDWSQIKIGLAWEKQGYNDYDQGAWYRTEVEVDADPKKPVYIAFASVDNDAWVYVNGKLVGEHHVWNRPFSLDISKAVKYKGKNTIAVRIYDGTGLGGIRGPISIHQPTDKK